jgi:type III secretory pathway component EscS
MFVVMAFLVLLFRRDVPQLLAFGASFLLYLVLLFSLGDWRFAWVSGVAVAIIQLFAQIAVLKRAI